MTIEEALSAIKNAVYGKDVRQAMHDGILQAEGGAGTVAKEAESSAKAAENYSRAIEGKADQALTTAKSANSKSDNTQLQLDEIVINGDSSVEAAQARVDIENVSYDTLKDRLDKEQQEVTAQFAQKVGGLEPKGLVGVSFDTQSPRIMDVIDDYVYGFSGTSLYRRSVDGGSWTAFLSNVPGSQRILKTDDGEMLVMSSSAIFKSNGWGTQSVTWQTKLSANDDSLFLRWGLDGDGKKFIATTYHAGNRAHSRYAWISLDSGDNWNRVYDSVEKHGATLANDSHMHAVAYDKYDDRFYLSEGHGSIAGIYVSEDDGQNWVRPEKMRLNPAPTTITVTPQGLVCGSDSVPNGLYGVVRNKDFMKEELVRTWTWQSGRDGLVGFAQRGFYDEKSGLVYVAFRSNYTEVKPVIAAGTPTSGGLVYTWDSGGVGSDDRIDNVVIPNENELLANAVAGSNTVIISGKISSPGTQTKSHPPIYDISEYETSSEIGWDASVSGARSLAIGYNAVTLGGQSSIALGYKSVADSNSIAIGIESEAGGTSVSIGGQSKTSGGSAVAVGYIADAQGDGVALGRNAKASIYGIAIGVNAEAINNATNAIAIGKNSKAHGSSVALGVDTETTDAWQVAIGQRHLEFEPLDAGNAGVFTAERVRLFTYKNGDGKLELRAQFPGADTYVNTSIVAVQGVRQ